MITTRCPVAVLPAVFLLIAGPAGASGQLDPTFGEGGFVTTEFHHATNELAAIAVQADGRLLATGATAGILIGLALARYTADGELDPTFGTAGVVLTEATRGGRAIALQADGKIVVAARGEDFFDRDFSMLRFDGDGDPDPSFGDNGMVTTGFSTGSNDQANAVVVQADGRIVAAGYTGADPDPANFALVRYLADGELDPTFGTGGLVVTDFGAISAEVQDLALQGDGKIVAAGRVGGDFAVARFLPDGSLDASFGVGGIVVTDFAGQLDYGRDMVLQADGRIVVAGFTRTGGVDNDFAVARYDIDGSLDPTFGTGGLVTTDLGGAGYGDYGHGVDLQADGRIVVSGDSGKRLAVVRYDTDGSLDASFGAGGVAAYDFGASYSTAVAVDPAGGIIAAGYVDGRFGVARLLTDGSLDAAFGAAGLAIPDLGISFDNAEAIAAQPDGKIVVAGRTGAAAAGGRDHFGVARYGPDGQPDAGFGISGRVVTRFQPETTSRASTVAVQPDGRIIAGGGTVFGEVNLARYLADGSLDPSFGTGGRVTTAAVGSCRALALQADGRIIVATWPGRGTDFGVLRYTSLGSLDATFGTDGVVSVPISGMTAMVQALAVQPDGKILVAGGSNQVMALARLDGDGDLDPSFGDGGVLVTDPTQQGVSLRDLALYPDGRFVVTAGGGGGFVLVRFHPDGSLDEGFGVGGVVTTEVSPETAEPSAVVLLPNGSITVVGTVGSPAREGVAVAQYLPDGELEAAFGDGGVTITVFGERDVANDLLYQPPGRIVVAGKSDDDFLVAAYTTDGALFADGFESGDTSAWSTTFP